MSLKRVLLTRSVLNESDLNLTIHIHIMVLLNIIFKNRYVQLTMSGHGKIQHRQYCNTESVQVFQHRQYCNTESVQVFQHRQYCNTKSVQVFAEISPR